MSDENQEDQDIHERHQAPAKPTKPAKPAKDLTPKQAQAIRDAHYYENGVKADGTGGTPPEGDK